MGRQVRAEVTRRRILDAAVELFSELGYGDTGLTEILQRADVTKGAFYYHFEGKEAVASAIIDESFQKVIDAADTVIESSSPALENIIRATFVVANVMGADATVQAGKKLAQALTQVSDRGPKAFLDWTSLFVAQVGAAVSQGDLRGDLDPQEVGETVWAPYWAAICCPMRWATTCAPGWPVRGGCCWPESYRPTRCRTSAISSPAPTRRTRTPRSRHNEKA